MLADSCIHIIRKGTLILALADIALIQHILKHQCPALLISVRMFNRIVFSRALGDGCQNRSFGNVQLADTLSEIPVRRRLNTQGILSQIDGVQIALQNLILTHNVFQLNSQILFLQLSFDLVQHGIL